LADVGGSANECSDFVDRKTRRTTLVPRQRKGHLLMEMHPTAYDDSNISEQMLSELVQLFFAETIFTFSHDELCDLAEYLRRRLYYGGIPCEDHVRWNELRADALAQVPMYLTLPTLN
jgi:hypothetical protein